MNWIKIIIFAGSAEEANECFNDAAAIRVQQQYSAESSLQKLNLANDNGVLPSNLGDTSPRKSKQLYCNNTRDIPAHPYGMATSALQQGNSMPSSVAQYDTPSPTVTQVSMTFPTNNMLCYKKMWNPALSFTLPT